MVAIHSGDDVPSATATRASVSRTLRSVIVANLVIGIVPTTLAFLTSGQFDRQSVQRWCVGLGVGALTVAGNWAQRVREEARACEDGAPRDFTRTITRDTARLNAAREQDARGRFGDE